MRVCVRYAGVYPRVCGGTRTARCMAVRMAGLSPRVRGNLEEGHKEQAGLRSIPRVRGNRHAAAHDGAAFGSIPACAGEPRHTRLHLARRQVYPRVCGGTILSISRAVASMGLSPRVRGNLIDVVVAEPDARSIPACAGEPNACTNKGRLSEVYPRVCGGTITPARSWQGSDGLSPRVRGNR